MASPRSSQDGVRLLNAAYVVPVRPRGAVLENHAVAVSGKRILDVLPAEQARSRWPHAERVELPTHVLLPGFVNAHTHASMTLLRGYADDMGLTKWLQEHIWPAELAFVGPGFVADGTRLAIAEMFRSGTTCFNDMYFFQDETIEACLAAGMRVCSGITVIEMASAWASGVTEYLDKGLALLDRYSGNPLVSFALAPHSPYTVSDESMQRVAKLSAEHDIPVHMHLLETAWEIQQSLEQHGKRPLRRLEKLGMLNQRLVAVHMTQIDGDDIARFADSGASIVHCPQSNLKLASGFCPVARLAGAGVNVAVGTDGAAANNDLDMLDEIQTAALLAKGVAGDASAVDAFSALEMGTLNGAAALGIGDRIGSIEPGKQADLCALDLEQPETQPLHNVVSQLIYAASARQVSDVWVAGRRVLENGELTTLDVGGTMQAAAEWQQKLQDFASSKATGTGR
ncbi:MAG: TRZ/ATZ family hydrolase [Xanthomonadales bacterium]|jgi:5-methylthioadenosine/S-adenosylhomocysteine deaminase|nr:TRZ/ATZ family hydrolase [Xanthomonadales bacterium]